MKAPWERLTTILGTRPRRPAGLTRAKCQHKTACVDYFGLAVRALGLSVVQPKKTSLVYVLFRADDVQLLHKCSLHLAPEAIPLYELTAKFVKNLRCWCEKRAGVRLAARQRHFCSDGRCVRGRKASYVVLQRKRAHRVGVAGQAGTEAGNGKSGKLTLPTAKPVPAGIKYGETS